MESPLPATFLLLVLLPLLLIPLAVLARRRHSRRTPPLRLLVVVGSGGHTTEILRLLSCLSESYCPRHYVLADSDKMSEAKIRSFEQKRAETFSSSQFTLDRIPRSREVRQSWTTSVVTTLYSILYSLPLIYKLKPDLDQTRQEQEYDLKTISNANVDWFYVYNFNFGNEPGDCAELMSHSASIYLQKHHTIDGNYHSKDLLILMSSLPPSPEIQTQLSRVPKILCNGPGTCVPVCISALLLGLLRMKRATIVYVESICRVETLSLSGKILYYFSDYFIVQWPALKEKYPKSVYLGRIV